MLQHRADLLHQRIADMAQAARKDLQALEYRGQLRNNVVSLLSKARPDVQAELSPPIHGMADGGSNELVNKLLDDADQQSEQVSVEGGRKAGRLVMLDRFAGPDVIDVSDQDRIEGRLNTSPYLPPGTWRDISRWAFHPDRLTDAPTVFAVPQWSVSLMCKDVLKQAVAAHALLGFRFDLLWSSETGGVQRPRRSTSSSARRHARVTSRRVRSGRRQ